MQDGRSVLETLLELIDKHRGAVLGVVAGILVALLFIGFGFWIKRATWMLCGGVCFARNLFDDTRH